MTSAKGKTLIVIAVTLAVTIAFAITQSSVHAERPPAVSSVGATALDDSSIKVIWSAHPDDATDYRVKWRRAGENYRPWTDNDWNAFPTGTSHTVTDLDADTTYNFKVRARFEGGLPSAWSSEISATTEESERTGRSGHIAKPTNFRVTNATQSGGVYETASSDRKPDLDWNVSQDSVGNYLTRKLIEPPAGVTCNPVGDCPLMTLYDENGTRNTGYTDVYNGGGKYRYWIYSRGENGHLGPAATIDVLIPSPPLPAQAAPTNLRLSARGRMGTAELNVAWDGNQQFHGYWIQMRRESQTFDENVSNRNRKNIASNPIEMYQADGKSYDPAGTTARWAFSRNANPDPWDQTYYVRVGTCADSTCDFADVIFTAEKSVYMGANPYD